MLGRVHATAWENGHTLSVSVQSARPRQAENAHRQNTGQASLLVYLFSGVAYFLLLKEK